MQSQRFERVTLANKMHSKLVRSLTACWLMGDREKVKAVLECCGDFTSRRIQRDNVAEALPPEERGPFKQYVMGLTC